MPRPIRRFEETDATRALAEIVKEYDETEERLRELGIKLKAAVVEAVKAGLPKAEAARRVGYSREYVSRLFTEAAKQDDGKAGDS